MTVEFLYWMPEKNACAGHVALRVNRKLFAYWPWVVRTDDGAGAVSGFINTDERLENFAHGLSRLAFDALRDEGKSMPAGIGPFKIIYEHFDEINKASFDHLEDFFNIIDVTGRVLENARQSVINACVALAVFVKANKYSIEDIVAFGKPTQLLALSFLEGNAIENCIKQLEDLDSDLLWYSKVGANTDEALNKGIKLRFPTLFMKEHSGLYRYQPKKIRHNCASSVLRVLQAGGLEKYLVSFKEEQHIVETMRGLTLRAAEAKNQKPNEKHLSSANNLAKLCALLGAFNYGKKPVSDWFGTSPEMVFKIVKEAKYEYEHPGFEKTEKYCSVM